MSNRNNAWETDYDDYGRNRGRYGNRDYDNEQERRTGGGYSRDYGGYGTGNYSRDYDTSGARYRGSMAGNQSGYGANDFGADYNDRSGYRGDRYDRGTDRGRYGYEGGGDNDRGNYGRGGYRGTGYGYGGYYGGGYYGGGGDYGRDNWSPYNEGDYGRRSNQSGRGRNDRDWWDRAGDEVASWFGDDEAERRRRMDERRNNRGGQYAGRGPKGYQRSDDRIREDVNDRLTDNSYLDASDIEVEVNDGIVKLSGHAEDRQAKRLAEDLAENVSGVKDVDNSIRINDQNWNDDETENRTVTSAANQ